MYAFAISLLLALFSTIIPVDKNDWEAGTTSLPYTKAVMAYANDEQFIATEKLRIDWGHIDGPCDECVGWAAMPRIQDMGRKIEVCNADGLCVGPLYVVDVASYNDLEYLRSVWWGVDISPTVYNVLWPNGNSMGIVSEWNPVSDADTDIVFIDHCGNNTYAY